MGLYENKNGVLSPIAGRGRAEYGASTVRTGTSSITAGIQAGAVATVEITFTEPMPDSNYLVDISFIQVKNLAFSIGKRQKNSFSVIITNTGTVDYFGADTMFKYTAFKLYTDTEYNDILTKMPELLSGRTTILSSSDDIDAIKDPGTYSWNDTANAPANVPLNLTYAILVHVLGAASGNNEQQFIFKGSQGIILIRSLSTQSPRVWGEWRIFQNNNYSTNEQIVGFYDGKPVYRRTIILNLPDMTGVEADAETSAQTRLDFPIGEIFKVDWSVRGYLNDRYRTWTQTFWYDLYKQTGHEGIKFSLTADTGSYLSISVTAKQGALTGSKRVLSFTNGFGQVTIEYTKTTD